MDTEAMELFGSHKRREARMASRAHRNEEMSKYRVAFKSVVRPMLKKPLEDFLNAAKRVCSKSYTLADHVVEHIPNVSADRILNDLALCDGVYENLHCLYIENLFDEELDDALDTADQENDACYSKLVALPQWKVLKKVCPYFDITIDPPEDAICISLTLDGGVNRGDFFDWAVGKFSSFDSFIISMVDDMVAMEQDDNVEVPTVKSISVGAVAALLGVVGTIAITVKLRKVLAAIAGVAIAGGLIYAAHRSHQIKVDKRYPTDGEIESFKVFETKYRQKLIDLSNELKNIINSNLGNIEGISVDTNIPIKDTKDPYSRLAVPVAKIKGEGTCPTTAWIKFREQLEDYIDDLEDEYNGLFKVVRGKTKHKSVIVMLSFNWMDNNGFILPNLR